MGGSDALIKGQEEHLNISIDWEIQSYSLLQNLPLIVRFGSSYIWAIEINCLLQNLTLIVGFGFSEMSVNWYV